MTDFIKKIQKIKFGLLSPEDIRSMSAVTVKYPDTYTDDGFPIANGLMDPRMGVIESNFMCSTCGLLGGDCEGHFGSIELALPVIHVGFADVIKNLLNSTCNDCGRVLLENNQIVHFTKKIKNAMDDRNYVSNIFEYYFEHTNNFHIMPNEQYVNTIFKEVYKLTRRKHHCPHCGAPQERIFLDYPFTIFQKNERLTPYEVRERLKKITDEDSFILGVNPEVARPEWMVLTVLPVPPVTVRPSITLKSGERAEDDLTHKLVDVLRINLRLFENMDANAPQIIVEDLWLLLEYHVNTYFNNDLYGFPPAEHRSGRPLITLMQRLNGHGQDAMHDASRGRFREHLTGKRVNFSGRTVMSPDPNISINEVGVPELIAKELTVPTRVVEWNIDEVREYIKNGLDIYPGANFIITPYGQKILLWNKEVINLVLQELKPGWIVERHLIDGDIVLFNRHPSLHKLSLLAHEVKVLPYNTFRINPAVCPPYNVDFDGDEMNIHVLQNDESRAEAKSLMLVENNMKSPRFGGPLVGAIRDHLSGFYLLTKSGTVFSEEEALQIIRKSGIEMPIFDEGHWILNQDPDIYKKKGELWTGKELFSLTLPNDLNMSFSAEISNSSFINPPEDAFVIIKDGILLQGVIDEAALGSFKGKILDKILMDYGSEQAREFLEKAISLSLSALMKIGITTSIHDYQIPKEANDVINAHLDNKMVEIDMIFESYERGFLNTLPGMTLEETLNTLISQVLSDARDDAGSIAEKYFNLSVDCFPFSLYGRYSSVMAHAGEKSSKLNITQITACVGPQSIRGQFLNNIFNEKGYKKRLLPHFKIGEITAKSRGFIKSSFIDGLNPIEFFLHAISGRDSMVDKSIRVAVSGYMQRRLVNALQDLHTDKNGLVKDAQGKVIQILYGEDGVDPVKSYFGKSVDLNSLIDEIKIENSEMSLNNSKTYNKTYSVEKSYENLSQKELKKLEIKSDYLSNKIKQSIKNITNLIWKINSELERINDENDENDVKLMINELKEIRRDLNSSKMNCNNFKLLDDVSEKIKNADNDIKTIKINFEQKLFEIFYLKLKLREKKFKEYNQLLLNTKFILEDKLITFSVLNTKLTNLIDNCDKISIHIDKKDLLKNLHSIYNEFNEQYVNLNKINDNLNNKNFSNFESVKQANDEINILNALINELDQLSALNFEEKIIAQEKVYQNLSYLDEKIHSGGVEKLLDECEKYFNRSMFKRQLKKYNLNDFELDIIKSNIKSDIVNQVIDENVDLKNIIKVHCEEYRENNFEFDEDEINELLHEITFSDVDDEIIDDCKSKVKKDFLEGNITINQVELKLINYINKKIKESDQLQELEKIKNDPDVPKIKIHLTQEEANDIYLIAKNEILSEYGINGNVENRIHFLAKKKIRENQSEARNRLNIIKRDFTQLTQLNNKQQVEFVNQIEYYINSHQIKYVDITEEYIIELCEDFIKNGQIKMR